MKLIPYEEISSDDDKLDAILEMLGNVLDELVESRLLFRHNLRNDVRSSWEEIKPNLERMRALLREQPDGLSAAGLRGSNLNLKYEGIFGSYWRLNRDGGTKRIKKFLRWAKIVVGSIATMVPVVKELAEILNEYMEAIEGGIEDAEEA